jgi:hypothetical protein
MRLETGQTELHTDLALLKSDFAMLKSRLGEK